MSNKATRVIGAPRGLASALLHFGSLAEMRAASPLPKDAQELIDKAVQKVGLERLIIAGDIMARGNTFNLPDPWSVTELYWEKESKVGTAIRTMEPKAIEENQLPKRTGARLPVYITMDAFNFGIRAIRAAERAGAPLDTSMIEQATRRVNEAIEDAAINGTAIQVAGNTTPGLLNAPNKNTQAYVDGEAWTHANHSGEDVVKDVLNMIGVLQGDHYYGPYTLYVPTTYGQKLNEDFKSATSGTILERLRAIDAGGGPLSVRVADQLGTDYTILMQTTSNVADMIVGQMPTVVSWEDGPGWNRQFAVLAVLVPRVKDDADSHSGICIGYTSWA